MFIDGVNLMAVILKNDMQLPLTLEEQNCFNNIELDIRKTILDLLHDESYRQDTISLLLEIIEESDHLSESQRKIVQTTCQKRIADLSLNGFHSKAK